MSSKVGEVVITQINKVPARFVKELVFEPGDLGTPTQYEVRGEFQVEEVPFLFSGRANLYSNRKVQAMCLAGPMFNGDKEVYRALYAAVRREVYAQEPFSVC